MTVRLNNTIRIAGIAAVLGLCGTAMAQSSSDGNFKKPLRGHGTTAQNQSSRSTVVMRQDDGENTVELRIADREYSAKLNGKEVPQDRIVHENDEVRILDGDGNTISTFHVSMDGKDGFSVGQPQPPKAPKAPKASRGSGSSNGAGSGWSTAAPMAQANPPKVMLGITMESPSEAQLKNYSLKEGESILVTRVIEGLAANKAGLKENDIITEIDGKKPVNQEILRDILKTKEPGDTVEFTVLRKGGDKSLRITLDKYDQEKLGLNTMVPDEAFKAWGGNGEAEDAFREAMKNRQWQGLTLQGDGQGRAFVFGNGADTDKKLAELDKKMADLDKKLEQVDAQITKLQALIEKLSEKRGK